MRRAVYVGARSVEHRASQGSHDSYVILNGEMSNAARFLRDTRTHAGLTQAELAERLGTTQSAVAKLERPGANPTVATLERAVSATGHRLQLIAPAFGDGADVSLLRQALRSSPQQRLESLQSLVRLSRLAGAVTRGRDERA